MLSEKALQAGVNKLRQSLQQDALLEHHSALALRRCVMEVYRAILEEEVKE